MHVTSLSPNHVFLFLWHLTSILPPIDNQIVEWLYNQIVEWFYNHNHGQMSPRNKKKNLTYTWHPDRSFLSLYSELLLHYYCIVLDLSGCATSAHVPPRMITLTPPRYHTWPTHVFVSCVVTTFFLVTATFQYKFFSILNYVIEASTSRLWQFIPPGRSGGNLQMFF